MKEILKSQEMERKERGFDDSDSDEEDLETLTKFFKKPQAQEKKKSVEELPKEEEEEEEEEKSLDISASDFELKATELSKIEEGDEDDPFSSFDQPLKRRNGLQDTNESGVVMYVFFDPQIKRWQSTHTNNSCLKNTGTDRSK